MTAAVIALLVVQLLWITKSVNIEKERFTKNVNDALLNITQRLVKSETATVIVQKFSDDGSILHESCDTITTNNVLYFIGEDEEETIEKNGSFDTTKLLRLTPPAEPDTLKNFVFTKTPDRTLNHTMVVDLDVDSFVTKRKIIVNDLIEELITRSKSKPIFERLDEDMLPRIINEELTKTELI